jgi:hypothetical protein
MTIQNEAKKIRRSIPRLKAGEKRRFTPKLRARILDWIDRAKADGLRDADCSRLLGIAATQFNAWRSSSQAIVPFELPMDWRVEPITRDLVPIQIPAGIELTSGVVVVSPRGFRVEGLNLEQAYALLREFS